MDYCRLCLSKLEKSHKIINALENNHEIHEKIIKIFNFTFDETNLSPFICFSCNERVESISEFIDSVLINQEKLQKINVTNDIFSVQLSNVVKEEPEEMETEFLEDELEEEWKLAPVEIKLEKNVSLKKVRVKCEYVCDICSDAFTSKTLLRRHMTQSHISEKEKVENEQKTVDITQYLACVLCELRPKFDTFEILMEHYKEMHGVRGYVSCCSKKLYTKRSVIYHSEFHERPADFMCPVCQKLLPNKYNLQNHIMRHKPDEEKVYKCTQCSKRYHHKNDLKQHVSTKKIKFCSNFGKL